MLLYFHNLQNRSGKINVHATHTVHAMHDCASLRDVCGTVLKIKESPPLFFF